MSKLEELIQKYCPDGVDYVKLGDIMSISRGASPRPIQNYLTDDENGIPWIKIGDASPNSKYISSTNERVTKEGAAKSRFLKKGSFILSNSMSFGRPYILDIDGCIHDGWISMCDFEASVNPDFLYHLLRSGIVQDFWTSKANSGGAVANLNSDIVRSTPIPLPPFPIQEEVVRLLDSYTDLQSELQTMLQTEQQKRKQQYNYHRDNLLSFEGRDDVKWKRLSDIASVYDGTHQTPAYKDTGIPFISVENIGDIYSSRKFISTEDFEKYKIKPQVGDVFMTRIGSIGVCAVFDKQADIAYYVSLALIRPNQQVVYPRYLKHIIESLIGCKELRKRTLVNAVPIKVNKDDIGKIVLPFPSLAEQKRIVDFLDRFDALTTDLTAGLPAEIEKRRQQYEFYRDKLLTFKRKEA